MTTLPAGRDLDALLAQAGWVRSLALQLCADVHAAEDAAQDAWLAAARRPPKAPGKLRSYLARTLRNMLRMNGRAASTRARHEGAAAKGDAHANDAAELIERAELHRHLVAAVIDLPPAQRDVVLWHWFDGEDVGALARRLGKSPDAVRSMLRRAREQLRQGIERRGALRSLAAFAAQLPAPAALLPAVITGGIVMKAKSIAVAAGVAVAALCVVVPVALSTARSDWGATVPSSAEPVAADVPGAHPSREAPALVREAAPVESRVEVRGRLAGLHARLPWTAPLSVRVAVPGNAPDRANEASVAVAADGAFAASLARADRTAMLVRIAAVDPWYRPVEHVAEVAAGAAVCDVVVPVVSSPVVLGSVTGEDGLAVALARVLAYAANGGVPKADVAPVASAATATDGTFRLRLDEPNDCIVVAVAPDERADLVPGGSASVTVGGVVELAPIVLPAAAAVTGTERWASGAPVGSGVVEWHPRSAVKLQGELALGWCADGTLTRRCTAATDAAGRFTLPARAGSLGNVVAAMVDGCRPAELIATPARAPQDVVLRIDGRPITIHVLKDGGPAGDVGIEWRREGFFRSYRTDGSGEVRQIVPDVAQRVRAVDRAGDLVSEWAEFPKGPPELVLLHLQPRAGEPVVVRLDGGGVLTMAAFAWRPPAGATISMNVSADDGRFTMRAPSGRYQLRVLPVAGDTSSYLLASEHDVVVPAAGEITLPVQLGGKLKVVVTAADGSFVGGHYRLTDRDGVRWPRASRDDPPPGTQLLVRFLGGRPLLTTAMPAGTYELLLDLGLHGERRESVEVAAGTTTDVRIRLP